MTQQSFWLPGLFGQAPPAGPPPIDERVNPPTPTESQGLEATIVGSMWNDPIALMGYSPGTLDWHRNTQGALGEYYHPDSPTNQQERIADTVRLRYGLEGDPDFPAVGRHEFRHRGMRNLVGLAREYQVPFNPEARPVLNFPYTNERTNVFEDRRLGHTESYPDMQYGRETSGMYEQVLRELRRVADEVNARRVQRMHGTGARWGELP